jgi:hypothetical protein
VRRTSNRGTVVTQRGDRARRQHSGLGLILPASVLLLWHLLGQYGIISELLFPAPYTIWSLFASLAASGVRIFNIEISIRHKLNKYGLYLLSSWKLNKNRAEVEDLFDKLGGNRYSFDELFNVSPSLEEVLH